MRKTRTAGLTLMLLAACSTVQRSTTRPDYETVDRTRTLRLVVITAPLPANDRRLGDVWSRMARRYVNHHRDFIAKTETTSITASIDRRAACSDAIEGILHLAPAVARRGDAVEASVYARLFRCSDGEEIWSAEAGGSWPSQDPNVVELVRQYVEEFGEDTRPYIAPTFHLLRATLDTLPFPALPNDECVMEKIELGE